MAEQGEQGAQGARGRGPWVTSVLTAGEVRLLLSFVAWLRADGLAICRNVGAERWAPIQEGAAALVVAFGAYLKDEEEGQGDG